MSFLFTRNVAFSLNLFISQKLLLFNIKIDFERAEKNFFERNLIVLPRGKCVGKELSRGKGIEIG